MIRLRSVLIASSVVLGVACSLNPQPEPPGLTSGSADGGGPSGAGGSGGDDQYELGGATSSGGGGIQVPVFSPDASPGAGADAATDSVSDAGTAETGPKAEGGAPDAGTDARDH